MKKIGIVLIFLSCFLTTGCFNYRDINNMLFVTALIIDADQDGSPVLYAETFMPFRSTDKGSEKGQRVIFKGIGKTMFEAVRDMNLSSSFKINYTQNKAIIFTEKAAMLGLSRFLDFLDRDQELLLRQYIVIYPGDPEELIKLKLKEEDYLGLFLADLINNQKQASRSIELRIDKFFDQRLVGDRTNVVTLIQQKKEQPDAKLEVAGGAVIRKDKLVGIIRRQEGLGFNFLMGTAKKGTLEITNPQYPEGFVTLEILNANTSTNVDYDGETIHFNKKIKVKASIADIQEGGTITKEFVHQVEEKAESNIKRACEDIFNEYKQKNIDIFDIEEVTERKYPRNKIDNYIINTALKVDVEVKIEGSSDITDFRQQ